MLLPLLATFIGNTSPCLTQFQEPNQFNPPMLSSYQYPELYISHILSTVSQSDFTKSLPTNNNLTPLELQAIHFRMSNPHILILPDNKVNTNVVLNKDYYVAEANRQLSNLPLTISSLMTYNQDQQCLHFSCCNPSSIKCSIPFSQALHGRHI